MHLSYILSRKDLVTESDDFYQFVRGNALTIIPHTNITIIATENIPVLLEFLASNRHITTLKLQGNNIDDNQVKALATGLANSNISDIDLNNNQIGDDGAQALAPELANSNIYNIDLSKNKIGDVGVKALATGLAHSNIHSIDLNNNQIGDEGAEALFELLQNNKLILSLSIEKNLISPEWFSKIKTELTQHINNFHIETPEESYTNDTMIGRKQDTSIDNQQENFGGGTKYTTIEIRENLNAAPHVSMQDDSEVPLIGNPEPAESDFLMNQT